MSEIEKKVFRVKKTTPGTVLFIVHPISNPLLTRQIILTDRNPSQYLPLDWALGIFIDDGNYRLFKSGAFTFENVEELVKIAYEEGVYFDEKLDFTPAKEDNEKVILGILDSGVRAKIEEAINNYGENTVKRVAVNHVAELKAGFVRMLEGIFKVQLTVDGGDEQ